MKKKIARSKNFLHQWLISKPINFVNALFDTDLESFREIYDRRVNEILPQEANLDFAREKYAKLVDRYYQHKNDRRNIFVFFFVTIPTLFGAIYFFKEEPNLIIGSNILEQERVIIIFSIFFTWATINMFNIYRRKIYKKTSQIMAYERAYPQIGNEFTLSSDINYKEQKLQNKYISTTKIYRVMVILVLFGLISLLYSSYFHR